MGELEGSLRRLQLQGRLPSIVGARFGPDGVDEQAGVRADPQTAYRIGSITKTLTAVLIMQLRDAGALDLADPVGRFLPETGYREATLRDLLSHASGMQAEPAGAWWERSRGGEFAELNAANDGSGTVAEPHTYYHYSNLAYGLLGEVIVRHHGAPWFDVVVARLLEPLGLARTSYSPVAHHAQGYSVEHFTGRLCAEPHSDTGAMAPAGQLWSTVGDLARWAQVLAGRVPEVLAAATAVEMATGGFVADYGLGVRIVETAGRRLVGHTGSMPGFLASLFVEQGSGEGVVTLCNATTGLDCTGVPAALLDGLPGGTVVTGVGGGEVEEWVPTDVLPEGVEELLGLWFWGNTALEFRWQAERLHVRTLQDGALSYEFEPKPGGWVGTSGYLRGERLIAHPTHLECATFIFTRRPYDPAAPIPGGSPG